MPDYPIISGNLKTELAAELGLETEMAKLALVIALENIQLLDRKHKDYGPGNIGKFGLQGCLIRGSDKLERILNLTKTDTVSSPQCESTEDNLRDWSNYGVIGLLCYQGKWK